MAEAGITGIRLTADTKRIELPDGSVITRQSTFVINGVTRTVANTTLMAEADGYRVVLAFQLRNGNFERYPERTNRAQAA